MRTRTPFLFWLIILATPITILFLSIWLLLHDSFLAFEYQRKGFKPDQFGFSTEQRLALGTVVYDYIKSEEKAQDAITLLGQEVLPVTETPLYTKKQLSHMVDVKRLIDRLIMFGGLASIVFAISFVLLWSYPKTRTYAAEAVYYGGILTLCLIVLLVIAGFLFSWDSIFTTFHTLFFEDNTWIFSGRTALIRLFPVQFWFDMSLMLAGFMILQSLILVIIGFVYPRRDVVKY